MSRIINDFIKSTEHGCGIGHFENDDLLFSYDRIGTNQIRKFERHGIVPASFMDYLKRKKAIKDDAWLPELQRTVHALLDLLSAGPNRPPGAHSEGEAFRDAFLLEMFPELRNKMGSSQRVWQVFERNGKLHGLKGPGGTAKEPDYLQKP